MSVSSVSRAAVALCALAALSLSAAVVVSAAPAKGNAAAAKSIYMSKCIACHKADGSGGVKLTGNATPNWKDPKVWNDPKRTDAFMRDCITNGKAASGMVAWGKSGQLKPQQVEDMIAYIRTTFGPKKK